MKPELDSFIQRKEDFKSSWENSLGHQLKSLPDFDKTYEKVVMILKGVL